MVQNEIQTLLDETAAILDNGGSRAVVKVNKIYVKIRALRGDNFPGCFGEDDCSTEMLSRCPWRMDCGN